MSCVEPVCEMLHSMEGGWVVIEGSHTASHGSKRVEPVGEILQGMEGGWVVIEVPIVMARM